ncbi:hypothetical protein VITU102760_12270 [Vibrio tubiashii]|uniref:Uncharacterized protein n=1 Tax=Vibrio tubiashii ATCC 19109 TaxID=1051646 RepID=A0ABN0DLV5_9VIBR|nr:hypothetical protein [Vibrio tubiashii]EGU59074.1 hypothetical protein VITU9109_19010 [Vibrio tubiashii ATCC 19109]
MRRWYLGLVPVLLFGSMYAYAASQRKRKFDDYSLKNFPDSSPEPIPNLSKLIDHIN